MKKSTILYIDDEPLNLMVFTAHFEQDYNIITLPSTHDVVPILNNNPIKVILSDQRMPDETGIDFLKRINNDFPDIIKIIITAYADQDITIKAINDAGIYKYLLKPWKYKDVKAVIDAAIREYDLQYERKMLLAELQKKNTALSESYNEIENQKNNFKAVFCNSNDGIFILNQEKIITEANQAFLKLIGLKDVPAEDDKTINAHVHSKFPELITMPADLANNPNSSIASLELQITQDEKKFIEINSNHISFNNKTKILSIIRDISERRLFEKKIVETIFKTQEEDQKKYARELHDGLGPLLSTLKMHIEWIANPENTTNKDRILQHSLTTIDQAIKSTKEIANQLSPHILQRFGLVNAISTYINQLKESTRIVFKFTSNLNERLNSNIETVLYRSILEGLNNSVKHSKASVITLSIDNQNEILKIELTDNGQGFEVEKEFSEGNGMGLFNIQNRIRNINGKFKIDSKIGSETNMMIIIPK